MYGSTCFGGPHAHHQERKCSSSLWFYRWSVVVVVLLVVVRIDHALERTATGTSTYKLTSF